MCPIEICEMSISLELWEQLFNNKKLPTILIYSLGVGVGLINIHPYNTE